MIGRLVAGLVVLATLATGATRAQEQPGPHADADAQGARFIRLIKGLQSKFKDQSFVYEGSTLFVGDPSLLRDPKMPPSANFQGFYAQRSDGAGLLDLYLTPLAEGQVMGHSVRATLHGKAIQVGQQADREPNPPRALRNAGLPALSGSPSPQGFNFIFFFQFSAEDYYARQFFRELGTRSLGGRDVLCVRYSSPVVLRDPSRADLDYVHLYVDLERDGHPVRRENYVDGTLVQEEDYTLEQVRFADGQEGWFPVAAKFQFYRWDDGVHSRPVMVEDYKVVTTSLRVNSGLGDDVFRIDQHGRDRFPPAMQEAVRRFEATEPMVIRTDYEGVQADLDKKLIEADAQSERLDASAAARPVLGAFQAWQAAAAVLGVGLLVTAATILARRAR